MQRGRRNVMELQTVEGGLGRRQHGTGRPIDLVHLSRMTLGDRSVEREVLALFSRQGPLLLARMRQVQAAGEPAAVAPIAHALKGSASGLGAWLVAEAAAEVESAAASHPERLASALLALDGALDDACSLIGDLLQPH